MNFFKKWYIYQKERFPILAYGTYVFSIVFATFCYNYSLIKNNNNVINYIELIPMFLVAIIQFLIVRIVDEFKDYKEDCKYRPYRPVPRGLVTLKELKILLYICIIAQIFITAFFNKNIILGFIYLIIMCIFFILMSKDFFLSKQIEKNILLGVFLDEILMPLLILYISTFMIKPKISLFLLMTYIASWIIEIARKVRSKEKEEKGVKTYTKILGIKKAMLLLCGLETIFIILNIIILKRKIIIIVWIIAIITNLIFAIKQTNKYAKTCEIVANIFVLIIYLSFGLLLK